MAMNGAGGDSGQIKQNIEKMFEECQRLAKVAESKNSIINEK